LTTSTEPNYATSWSPDGRYLLVTRIRGTEYDVWAVEATPSGKGPGGRKAFPVIQTKGYAGSGAFSPDGKWIAYHAAASGRNEIFVQPFAETAPSKQSVWQVSAQGGMYPQWRADGKELFYLSTIGSVMAAPVHIVSGAFESDPPAELFRVGDLGGRTFAAAADGLQFLILAPASRGPSGGSRMTAAELRMLQS